MSELIFDVELIFKKIFDVSPFFPLMSRNCVRYWQIRSCEGYIILWGFVGNRFKNMIPLKVTQFEPIASPHYNYDVAIAS